MKTSSKGSQKNQPSKNEAGSVNQLKKEKSREGIKRFEEESHELRQRSCRCDEKCEPAMSDTAHGSHNFKCNVPYLRFLSLREKYLTPQNAERPNSGSFVVIAAPIQCMFNRLSAELMLMIIQFIADSIRDDEWKQAEWVLNAFDPRDVVNRAARILQRWDNWETAFTELGISMRPETNHTLQYDQQCKLLVYRAFSDFMDDLSIPLMTYRAKILTLDRRNLRVQAALERFAECSINELRLMTHYDAGDIDDVLAQVTEVTLAYAAFAQEDMCYKLRAMMLRAHPVFGVLMHAKQQGSLRHWRLDAVSTGRNYIGLDQERFRLVWEEVPMLELAHVKLTVEEVEDAENMRCLTAIEQALGVTHPSNPDSASNPQLRWAAVDFFTGLGSMPLACSEFEIMVLGVCEIVLILVSILLTQFPFASACLDYRTDRWRSWTTTAKDLSYVIELLTASPMCNPFSKAGARRQGDHPEAVQVEFIATAAAVLGVRWVMIENVPELVTEDRVHGVFTSAVAAFKLAKMVLIAKEVTKHSDVGGVTIRARCWPVFENDDVAMFMPLWENLVVDNEGYSNIRTILDPVDRVRISE